MRGWSATLLREKVSNPVPLIRERLDPLPAVLSNDERAEVTVRASLRNYPLEKLFSSVIDQIDTHATPRARAREELLDLVDSLIG